MRKASVMRRASAELLSHSEIRRMTKRLLSVELLQKFKTTHCGWDSKARCGRFSPSLTFPFSLSASRSRV